jgi:hypothetical protein|tara:strand:+ start:8558 stop:10273 length:1716 start_codon:yes stop_codon:yes gene_type:complete
MNIDVSTKAMLFVQNDAKGQVLTCAEGLSFWGGVDPSTGTIIDVHHPNHGEILTGKIVLMPTSRGSCSGSGVLLQLARIGLAPAALVFREEEDILTLGAIIAAKLFEKPVAILRLPEFTYDALSKAKVAEIYNDNLSFLDQSILLLKPNTQNLQLVASDLNIIKGHDGQARKLAIEVICLMASVQGATELIDVSRGHIDGCILAHDANLDFAEKMHDMGAKTCIPTTINAISVDRENWHSQGFTPDFGMKASRLADAYVNMGARPTFTCAPYLLDDIPIENEAIGWSESNAVIFANSVLGARTQKHPDYLDLFIAMTGRAPNTGVYLAKNRVPTCELHVEIPENFDDAFWPMLGWLAGTKSPNGIPVLCGLEALSPTLDDLKSLCAAFGTTSAAPLIHMRGHTPEGHLPISSDAKQLNITINDLVDLWHEFNVGDDKIDLVAIGSPHASIMECRKFADFFNNQQCFALTKTIITVGRQTLSQMKAEGIFDRLKDAGIQVISDICWCSITEPVFPVDTLVLMTNSGKYAHYGKGLTGRDVRFGSLKNCALASLSGQAQAGLPEWLLSKKHNI